jgi:cysteine synthase A
VKEKDMPRNVHESILSTIGRTPVVRLTSFEKRFAPKKLKLYAKVEAFNPGGSVKDRLALGVIEDAERKGLLKPGQTVVEATNGNTGIGLAVVCAQKGYPLVITMAESFSVERRKLMRFLGAKVVLTPAALKGTGMVDKARELAETHGWFLARQFENEANPDMHSKTTAQEILADFETHRLDYWVTGYGTGGTLKGVGRVLREKRPDTKIVVCEPDNSPLLGSGAPQERRPDGAPAVSHPAFRPHVMQGWTPDFIPKITGDAVAMKLVDQLIAINGAEAMANARELARKEGIFVGTTSGATLTGALKVCEQAEDGATILCMLPDTGERYLSTPLFEGVAADMNDEELDISRSTPSARFDAPTPAPAPAAPAASAAPAAAAGKAAAFVAEAIADRAQPVTMFALEWCEFCWSVRTLFARLGIDYRSVDIDAAANQKDDWGGKVRAALRAKTGVATIPQIFVGGELVGGATDALEAYETGRLQTLLRKAGVRFDEAAKLDPQELLPKWLHSRAPAA